MIKLIDIVKEEVHKTQAMKDARDIADRLARRGYTPQEAINDAASSVKARLGYELTDEDKKSLLHWVYVHPNFR